jgi:hypothetical protein
MSAEVIVVQVKTSTSGAKTTVLTLYPQHVYLISSGTAQGGSSSTIYFDTSGSDIDDFYNGAIIVGSLDGTTEVRMISDYSGSSKIATVDHDWVTTPDSDDTYIVYGFLGRPRMQQVDVVGISGDTTAANNLESYCDGTTPIPANATQISGDATAADNLEKACDGTGYNVGGGSVVAASVTAGVTLADDAITAAKFDESTAFPLKSADTGATAVARTGADSDTLETLSDQIDGVPAETVTVEDVVNGILAGTIEGTLTLQQVLRVLLAEAAGITTGSRSTSIAFRDQADTKDRIAGTMDSTGNRTTVVLDVA